MARKIRHAVNWLLDVLIPDCCAGCSAFGVLLCQKCWSGFQPKLRLVQVAAPKWLPTEPNTHQRMEGLALVNYEDAASVLHQYKEKLIRNLAKVFAQQLAIALQQVPLPDRLVLVPVPSARKTTRTRGFSPAKEIAAELAPLLPGHVSVLAALRVRAARRDQAGADQSQRWQNLNERFSVVYQPPQGSEIWLVDDIVTTGATLLSAQQALLESGVKTTKFITFAETKLKIPRG